jgi:hypothetical protein
MNLKEDIVECLKRLFNSSSGVTEENLEEYSMINSKPAEVRIRRLMNVLTEVHSRCAIFNTSGQLLTMVSNVYCSSTNLKK